MAYKVVKRLVISPETEEEYNFKKQGYDIREDGTVGYKLMSNTGILYVMPPLYALGRKKGIIKGKDEEVETVDLKELFEAHHIVSRHRLLYALYNSNFYALTNWMEVPAYSYVTVAFKEKATGYSEVMTVNAEERKIFEYHVEQGMEKPLLSNVKTYEDFLDAIANFQFRHFNNVPDLFSSFDVPKNELVGNDEHYEWKVRAVTFVREDE